MLSHKANRIIYHLCYFFFSIFLFKYKFIHIKHINGCRIEAWVKLEAKTSDDGCGLIIWSALSKNKWLTYWQKKKNSSNSHGSSINSKITSVFAWYSFFKRQNSKKKVFKNELDSKAEWCHRIKWIFFFLFCFSFK